MQTTCSCWSAYIQTNRITVSIREEVGLIQRLSYSQIPSHIGSSEPPCQREPCQGQAVYCASRMFQTGHRVNPNSASVWRPGRQGFWFGFVSFSTFSIMLFESNFEPTCLNANPENRPSQCQPQGIKLSIGDD